MVTLPEDFVATKWPGYFFNITDKQLYSVKVTGMLKPLAKIWPNYHNNFFSGYKISIKGNKRLVDMQYLESIKPCRTVYPVFGK